MIKNRTAILLGSPGSISSTTSIGRSSRRCSSGLKRPSPRAGSIWSNKQAGLLATAFLLGYFVTSPLFGSRADKGARKGLIAVGVAVWSIATMVSGFAESFGMMIAARVFVGVGEASYATLAPTIIN